MATQKPISTISYNTEAFLVEMLNKWFEAHIISAYQYICHKGEDGDKDHIHLRIEPNKKLDPMTLLEELREFVRDNDKPLGCRPFRPSKEEDWFLYVVHDLDYMKLKYPNDRNEKLPYSWEEIKASPYYDVQVAFIRAKASLSHNSASVLKRLASGTHPLDLVAEGENVFTVNAVYRLGRDDIVSQLQSDYDRVVSEKVRLVEAIQKAGFDIELSADGEYKLVLPGQ